jgi:hypothetical protein
LFTSNAESWWRCVDYPWVLSATFAVITTIITIDSKFYHNEAERLTTAFPETQTAITAWGKTCDHYIKAINEKFKRIVEQEQEGTVTMKDTYQKSSEVLQQLCKIEPIMINLDTINEKIKLTEQFNTRDQLNDYDLLTRIYSSQRKLTADDLTKLKDSLEPWRHCLFFDTLALNLAIINEVSTGGISTEEVPGGIATEAPSFEIAVNPNIPISLSLAYVDSCLSTNKLLDTLSNILTLQNDIGFENSLAIFYWATETPWHLRWWYLALLFFAGLRLGKVTAEIKKGRTRSQSQET